MFDPPTCFLDESDMICFRQFPCRIFSDQTLYFCVDFNSFIDSKSVWGIISIRTDPILIVLKKFVLPGLKNIWIKFGTHSKLRGCSHIMSVKNGGQDPPSPLVCQKTEICSPLSPPCQKSYFVALQLIK